MRWLSLLCMAIASLPCALIAQAAQSPSVNQDATVTFAAAQQLAAQGRLEKAMTMLDQLAVQSPEPQGVERLRGMIFYEQAQFARAIEAFARASAQDPADRESIEMRGVSLFRSGHSAEAIPFLEHAHAAVERANIDPQYILGLCYADVGRYDDARHAFATQYGFAADSAEAHLLAARLFLRREFAAQAMNEAQKAIAMMPTLPLAHQLLGEVALAKGDLAAAIRELEMERKLNPLNGVLYDRLGDAYLRNEQFAEAQQALDRAVLLEPSATAPYILLGQTFLKQKNPIQALHYLDRAVKMDPANSITHNLLGQAYKATGQMTEANREFKLGVDLQHKEMPQGGVK